MTTDTAAWIPARGARLSVGTAPHTAPGEGQLVVRNRAVAVNPVDWITQGIGRFSAPWLRYPTVLGSDLAGEVVEVGPGVTRFAVGDRVLAHALGADRSGNRAAEGAFRLHTVVSARMAAPIPDDLSYEEAAVLPLAVSTAACGLFQTDHLALRHPGAAPVATGETVLVWGGSTSVGCNAVQLAAAAGYDVVTTASPRNHDLVRGLGAARVLDHRSPAVVDDVVAALRGTTLAGALAIGDGSAQACVDVVRRCRGARVVAMTSPPASLAPLPESLGAALRTGVRMGVAGARLAATALPRRIRTSVVWGTSLVGDEVGTLLYEDFLPAALAEGRYVAAPAPRVVGHGLEHVQTALDVQRAGVSAQKVVVSL